MIKATHKITSIAVALFLLVSSNFCLAECVCAAEESDHSAQTQVDGNSADHHHASESDQDHSDSDHHETDQDHSGADHHETEAQCCSSLVADKTTANNPVDIKLLKNSLSQILMLESVAPQLYFRSSDKVEYPPGASPPAVFLLNHFTHAPPASL